MVLPMYFLEFEKVDVEYIWTTLIRKHFWRKLLWRKNLFSTPPLPCTLNNAKIKCLFLYIYIYTRVQCMENFICEAFTFKISIIIPLIVCHPYLMMLVWRIWCWIRYLLIDMCLYSDITKLLDIVRSDIVRRN